MITRRFKWISLVFTLVLFAAPAFAQSALENPAGLREQAPATYKARFDTSKGVFVIEVTRAWAPRGADRFYNLVKNGFYDNTRFFRVISGFMVQSMSKGQADRLDEFSKCARAHYPTELDYLMPKRRINPEGDRAERWQMLLIKWRAAAGLPPVR